MGAALNTAAGLPACALTDRGTWISFEHTRELKVLFEGGPALCNSCGVILKNPVKHPHMEAEADQAFINRLLPAEGQSAGARHGIDGQCLLFLRAGGPSQAKRRPASKPAARGARQKRLDTRLCGMPDTRLRDGHAPDV